MLRINLFLVVFSMLLSQNVVAESYWVLGSYAQKSNAIAEQVRLGAHFARDVLVVPNLDANTFRVVVRMRDVSIEQLADANVEYWLVGMADSSARSIATTLAYPDMQTDETPEAYCARIINLPQQPSGCDPIKLQALQTARTALETLVGELTRYCAIATDESERQICDRWRAGENLAGSN